MSSPTPGQPLLPPTPGSVKAEISLVSDRDVPNGVFSRRLDSWTLSDCGCPEMCLQWSGCGGNPVLRVDCAWLVLVCYNSCAPSLGYFPLFLKHMPKMHGDEHCCQKGKARRKLTLASSVHERGSLPRHTRCLWKHQFPYRRRS